MSHCIFIYVSIYLSIYYSLQHLLRVQRAYGSIIDGEGLCIRTSVIRGTQRGPNNDGRDNDDDILCFAQSLLTDDHLIYIIAQWQLHTDV